MLLNVSSDEKILPTTYGELRPPLGKHRLKVSLLSNDGSCLLYPFLFREEFVLETEMIRNDC